MKWLIRIIFICFLMPLLTSASFSQRVISELSDRQISIDSGFSGETITIFGNIEPEIGSNTKYVEGTYSIIVVIKGPAVNRVIRQKDRKIAIWLNSEQMIFKNFPSYYWLISSDKLESISPNGSFEDSYLLPKNQPFRDIIMQDGKEVTKQTKFGNELVRLMKQKGLFGIDENGVKFHSNTLYSIKIDLPSDVPIGYYLTTTYLFKDGKIINKKSEGFSVQKTGIERLLGSSAKQFPLFYGIFTVLLALFTGWLGGVAFRR